MKLRVNIRFKKNVSGIALCLLVSLIAFSYISVSGNKQNRELLVSWQPITKPTDARTHTTSAFSPSNHNATLARSDELVIYGGSGGSAKDSPQHSYYSRGWSSGSQWWQLSGISLEGYQLIELSFWVRSSDTGPRNFAIEYSRNGNDWYPLTDSSNVRLQYTITTDNKLAKQGPIPISSSINNINEVSIRFINTDTQSVSGDTIKSTGTSYITDIVITGVALT